MAQILCLAQSLQQVVVMEQPKQELAVGLVALVEVEGAVEYQLPVLVALVLLGKVLLEELVLLVLIIRGEVVVVQPVLVRLVVEQLVGQVELVLLLQYLVHL